MKNHRSEQHRQQRGRSYHQRQRFSLNRVELSVEAQVEILREDCIATLEKDALFQRNMRNISADAKQQPSWFQNNLIRTLIMRALGRAGHSLKLSRSMCFAYGYQPAC